jgi:uncharacterized membrane protein
MRESTTIFIVFFVLGVLLFVIGCGLTTINTTYTYYEPNGTPQTFPATPYANMGQYMYIFGIIILVISFVALGLSIYRFRAVGRQTTT